MTNVKIESDSRMALLRTIHKIKHILEEARRLSTGSISHIFRQANQTADCLAHLGFQQEEDLIVTRNVPFPVREFVMANALGVGNLRT